MHHYRLTYDHRSSLQVKDLLLSDHARFPVFHVEFQRDVSPEACPSPGGARGGRKGGVGAKRGQRAQSVRFPGGTNMSECRPYRLCVSVCV